MFPVGNMVQLAYGATLLIPGVYRGVFAVELDGSTMWRGMVLIRLMDCAAYCNAMTPC